MKPRTALWISLTLTVFTLIVVAGVVMAVRASGLTARAAPATTEVATTQAATQAVAAAGSQAQADPSTLAPDREQAYRSLIEQANQRLLQDQKEIQNLQTQLQNQAQPAQGQAAQAPAQLTPAQAADIASKYLSENDVATVAQVQSNGQVLYQVAFKSGYTVWVTLQGQVAGVQAPELQGTNPSMPSGSGQGGGGGGGGEHEYHSGGDD